jgi:aerobic-type carbon monoxide dehydrogenase small subunit (CoxS/CutS family)
MSGHDDPVRIDVPVDFLVNGEPVHVEVAVTSVLADVLRDDCGLTGTKIGCGVGVCGACTVLVEGEPASACLTLTVQVDGRRVETIEAGAADPDIIALQQAFVTEGGFQCGFCTSGQIMALVALQRERAGGPVSVDDVRHHLTGNVCRCTGYCGIVRAACKVLGS